MPPVETESSKTRYIANVRAGELDTDAVNLAQVKELIEAATAPLLARIAELENA